MFNVAFRIAKSDRGLLYKCKLYLITYTINDFVFGDMKRNRPEDTNTDQEGEVDCNTKCCISTSYPIILGHPKPKKMLIFCFVGIFEYIILLMLILFLDMCQNS